MAEPQKHPWRGRWSDHVQSLVSTKGHQSILGILRAMQGMPYSKVSDELGGIPPIQVISLAFAEAETTGDLPWVIRDCLCRNIVEACGNGWGEGEEARSRQMLAASSWVAEVTGTGNCTSLKDQLRSMAHELLAMKIDPSWVPASNSDPIFETLFAQLELDNQ